MSFVWDRREWYDEKDEEGEIIKSGIEKYPDGADGSKISRVKDKDNPNGGIHVGMIAQEVESILDGYPEFKDSGIVSKNNPDKLEFGPQQLIYPLINAAKELSAEVEELSAKVTALETA